MWDAVSTTLPRTTAGMARPTGPATPIRRSTWPTTSAIACGVAGDGVGNRTRSMASSPVAMSTGATLIPVPPISTPTTRPDAGVALIPCHRPALVLTITTSQCSITLKIIIRTGHLRGSWSRPGGGAGTLVGGPGFGEEFAGVAEEFGEDAGLADDGHEVGVTAPARDHVLVQVGRDAGAGHAAQVHADVEALRVRGRAQGPDRALGVFGQFGGLARVQFRVVGHVPVRADQEVAAVVGVQVQHREHGPAARDDQAFLVTERRSAAERAGLALAGPGRFVLALEVGHPVRHPQPRERVRDAGAGLRP